MARIRSVHPGLASDEAFMTMSMAAKAAWALLWTECDDHGLFEWKPIVLKARIFPADAVDFAAILGEYESLDCVKRVEIDGKSFGLIRNFGKYQRPKNPSYRYQWSDDFASYAGFTVALPQPSPSHTEKPPQRKEEGGIEAPTGLLVPPVDKSIPIAPRAPAPGGARTGATAGNEDAQWQARLRGYRVGGRWPGMYGPRPESGECYAPKRILEEWLEAQPKSEAA